MYLSPDELRQERRERRLVWVFGAAVCVALITIGVLGFVAFLPSTPLVRLGSESMFTDTDTQPVDVAVKQLGMSKLIPNRPALSEDVIFVVRDRGSYRAFLGTDPLSGCFLSWRDEEQIFRDTCEQHCYGLNGRNVDQLILNGKRPVNMVELPVTVRDGVLFVEDRIVRRGG